MKNKLLIVVGLCLLAMVSAGTATAQVSCAGVPAFASCTAYANGASVTYNGSKYTAIAPIPATRDCPPNSPYNPSTDNWWTNNGTCSGATATPTSATATPTTGATATATGTSAAGCAIGATCEAESAARGGGVVTSTLHAGYTGSGFADYQGNGTGYVEWTVSVPTAGTYALNIRYGNGGTGDRPMSISVNGTVVNSAMSFPVTGWTSWTVRTQNASLPAGSVRIRLLETPNGPNVDNLTVTGGSGTPTATSRVTPTRTPTATPTRTATSSTPTPTTCTNCTGGSLGGYFAQWGIYARNYQVSMLPADGRIYYAFNNPYNGQCELGVNQAGRGDQWADYGQPQNGEAYNAPLKGNFHSLQLKRGGSNVSISIGGWTWSDGFYPGSKNRASFVASCVDKFVKGNIPLVAGQGGPGTAANIFDGIDLDWEYPGVCGNNPSCGASSADKANNTALMIEFRNQMNAAKPGLKLTSAVAAGVEKIAIGYDSGYCATQDQVNIMTYDFFGGWAPQGPTAPHSPLTQFAGQASYPAPTDKYYTDAAVQAWKALGCPSNKLHIGIGAYGRGWTGSFSGNGLNQPATGAASGTYEAGVDDYDVLVSRCPSNNTGAGTAWCNSGGMWFSYDTPATIGTKKGYRQSQGLGGMFMWAFDGDNGQVWSAMH